MRIDILRLPTLNSEEPIFLRFLSNDGVQPSILSIYSLAGINSGSRAFSSALSLSFRWLGVQPHLLQPATRESKFTTISCPTFWHSGHKKFLISPDSHISCRHACPTLVVDRTYGRNLRFGWIASAGSRPARFMGRILDSGDLRLPAPWLGFLHPGESWPLGPGSFLLAPPAIPLHAVDVQPNVSPDWLAILFDSL
mgnify:CR=1 FL=1